MLLDTLRCYLSAVWTEDIRLELGPEFHATESPFSVGHVCAVVDSPMGKMEGECGVVVWGESVLAMAVCNRADYQGTSSDTGTSFGIPSALAATLRAPQNPDLSL